MKKFAHLEGGIDTWDDFNLDWHRSPSGHEPTDEEIDFLIELGKATIFYNFAFIWRDHE